MSNPNRDNLYTQQIARDAVSATATLLGAASGVARDVAMVNASVTALELSASDAQPVIQGNGDPTTTHAWVVAADSLVAGTVTLTLSGNAAFPDGGFSIIPFYVGNIVAANAGILTAVALDGEHVQVTSSNVADDNFVGVLCFAPIPA